MNEKKRNARSTEFDPLIQPNKMYEQRRKKLQKKIGKFNNRNSGNMIRTKHGVSSQIFFLCFSVDGRIQAYNIRSNTNTQFTHFELHFTAIWNIVLFHFKSFCQCHKIVVIIFFSRSRSGYFLSHFFSLHRSSIHLYRWMSVWWFPILVWHIIFFCDLPLEFLSNHQKK